MNTKQLQYVLVLANAGSFSRAADMLNISQPSLSQYIKKIEKEIGTELFDRTNGEVRLTDAGRVYIDAGRKILDLEHQMESAISDLNEYKSGSVIVGAAPYRAASMIPAIASAFRKIYPGMHLVVREETTAELADGMTRGEYDLTLTLLPVDKRFFDYEKVMEEEIVLAVPASFDAFPASELAFRRYPAIDTKVLNGQSLVMLTEHQFMQQQLQDLCNDHKLDIKPAAVVKSIEAQIEMVKMGVGIALVPSGAERFCSSSEVTFYSFKDELPRREIAVIWRRDRKLSKVAEDLKNIICSMAW